MIYILKTRRNYDTPEFSTCNWEDVMKKPFKVMLTQHLADELGWPLSYDGCWWVDVDLTKRNERRIRWW